MIKQFELPEKSKIISVKVKNDKVFIEYENEKIEIETPLFKKGDFVKFDISENIIILSKDTYSTDFYKSCFIKICKNGKLDWDGGSNPIFPITDEEKQNAINILRQNGKDWDAENLQLIDYKWIPKDGEKIHYTMSDAICSTFYNYSHKKIVEQNNYFKTYELAESALKARTELFKTLKHY